MQSVRHYTCGASCTSRLSSARTEVHRVADRGAPPAGALTPGHDLLRRSQWASAFADSELPSILAGRLGEETRSGQAAATISGVQLSVSRRFV